MMKAYLNYPNQHMTIHCDSACREISKMGKANQRVVAVARASFAQVIGQLASDSFRLGSHAAINDLWLSIDFDDVEFEEALAKYAFRLLGQRYAFIRDVSVTRHC